MRSILLLILMSSPVLGQVDVTPQPAVTGLWLVIGPSNQVLPNGSYRFLFIPSSPNEQVQVTTIVAGEGAPIPPPGTGDLRSKIVSALGKVTEENKAVTAKGLAGAYRELIKTSELAGTPSQFNQGIAMLTGAITAGKAGWPEFVNLLNSELNKATTLAECVTILTVFAEELE